MTKVFRRLLLSLAWAPVACAQPTRLVIILLGPPGGGKGTQAERITAEFRVPALSTGEVLRAEVKAGTALGKQLQQTMAEGKLVDDSIVNRLVGQRTENLNGYILDGYPRTTAQAEFLDHLLKERGYPPPLVLNFDVPTEEIVKRLAARGRADDKPEVIRERMKVYARDTEPLIRYYSKGNYRRIDGVGSIEEIYQRVREAIRASIAAGGQ